MGRAPKRPYRKQKRAVAEEETRRRITEAAVELHSSVGPAKTTVTDVAELAGVSRMTVYNHFPTDTDLFTACSSHWARKNPFPEPNRWGEVEDPTERLARALADLYGWYAVRQGMLSNVFRDAPLVPAVAEIAEQWWGGYLDEVLDVLARGWPVDAGTEGALRATLRVVIDFHTWQILSTSGLGDEEAARIASKMVSGVGRKANSRAEAVDRIVSRR
jgi:AcrR family transcriptional regulator